MCNSLVFTYFWPYCEFYMDITHHVFYSAICKSYFFLIEDSELCDITPPPQTKRKSVYVQFVVFLRVQP